MLTQTNIKVKLIGEDGNAFNILGKVSQALKKNGYKEMAQEFMAEATKGDYNHLLRTCMKVVKVC